MSKAASNASKYQYQLDSKEQEQLKQLLDNSLMRHIIVIRSEQGYGFTLSRSLIGPNEDNHVSWIFFRFFVF
jgi:hypothetical protein